MDRSSARSIERICSFSNIALGQRESCVTVTWGDKAVCYARVSRLILALRQKGCDVANLIAGLSIHRDRSGGTFDLQAFSTSYGVDKVPLQLMRYLPEELKPASPTTSAQPIVVTKVTEARRRRRAVASA